MFVESSTHTGMEVVLRKFSPTKQNSSGGSSNTLGNFFWLFRVNWAALKDCVLLVVSFWSISSCRWWVCKNGIHQDPVSQLPQEDVVVWQNILSCFIWSRLRNVAHPGWSRSLHRKFLCLSHPSPNFAIHFYIQILSTVWVLICDRSIHDVLCLSLLQFTIASWWSHP